MSPVVNNILAAIPRGKTSSLTVYCPNAVAAVKPFV